jgi:hypothetical protein
LRNKAEGYRGFALNIEMEYVEPTDLRSSKVFGAREMGRQGVK